MATRGLGAAGAGPQKAARSAWAAERSRKVNDQTRPSAGGPDDPIVAHCFILAAVKSAADREPKEEQELIRGEPLLSEYLRCGVLEVIGKLALAGAGHELIENVAEDLFRLVDVAATATRDAYRALLSDFLPENGTNDQPPPSDALPTDHQS